MTEAPQSPPTPSNPGSETAPAPAAATPSPPWGLAGWAIVAGAFLLGFIVFPLRTVGTKFDYLPGDPADNRLNNYILEHGYRYLTGKVASFWDAPMFYPAARVTAWSDAHLGMLPLYAAERHCGLSVERAFQGHFLACFVLNFVAAMWALRRLGLGPAGVAVGAYLFTYALPVAAQLQHTQLYPRFMVPLALVFAWEFLRTPRTWRLAVVAWSVAAQTYLTVYIGYFLVLALAGGLFVTLIRYSHQLPCRELILPNWRVWLARLVVTGAAAGSIIPLALAHDHGVGKLTKEHVLLFAPKPAGWITPPVIAATFPELADETGLGTWKAAEQQLLPGVLTLLVLAIGLLAILLPGRPRTLIPVVAVSAWSAVLIAVFMTPLLSPFRDFWLYEYMIELPGAGGIRAIGRVVLVLLFPAAVVLGGIVDGFARLSARISRFGPMVVGLLALAAVAADHWLTPTEGPKSLRPNVGTAEYPPYTWAPMRCSLADALTRQKVVTDAIRTHPAPTVVYVFPSAGKVGPVVTQLDAMHATQDIGVPCVNGWSGHFPKEWNIFLNYRTLIYWLTVTNQIPDEQLAGLVVIGDPLPDADPAFEAEMRAKFPPQPLPPMQK